VKILLKIVSCLLLVFIVSQFTYCKKDKFITDSGAKVEFSQDSVLFDTVFTAIGSATQNIRVRNKNKQKIKISSIQLQGGSASQFIINVDGAKGTSFSDIEIAANDSIYIFIQVNVNPTNSNSPLIITDFIHFIVNGNEQKVVLEAWGQDAYYHRPDSILRFKDGSFLPYSVANAVPNSYNIVGSEIVWKNDKPHVVYGYLVVDGPEGNAPGQKLKILEGTKVYMNSLAAIWVYAGGQLQVLGKKDKEVVFQGVRREKELADEPSQWDRIWINEGSDQNIIDYAIIKNAFIGVQCELFGDDSILAKKRQLTITNTKIQNMGRFGLYSVAYNIYGGNNVISNCKEYSLNILLGGAYRFIHCTFANYWSKDARDKQALMLNNNSTLQVLPLSAYFGNCIIDGKLDNELSIDVKTNSGFPTTYTFSNCYIKTNTDISSPSYFFNNVKGDKNSVLNYKDVAAYNFEPLASETWLKNFVYLNPADQTAFPNDIMGKPRNTTSVTAGAYHVQ
jgi:hypothetical protein